MSPPPPPVHPPVDVTGASEMPVMVSVLNQSEGVEDDEVVVVAATTGTTALPPMSAIIPSSRPRSSSSSTTSSSSSSAKSTKSGEGGEKEWANKRLLVSLGMLLPALAAIIGKWGGFLWGSFGTWFSLRHLLNHCALISPSELAWPAPKSTRTLYHI